MAIVLIRQDDKLELWKQAFLAYHPKLPVYHYLEDHPKKEISMAIVWKHPQGSLAVYPNLKCIASFGAGVDFIFKDPDLPSDIPITRVIDPLLADDMAEYVLAAILGYLKQMRTYDIEQINANWHPKPYSRISDHTVGIMGAGTLGITVSAMLVKMGFKVIGWSRSPRSEEAIPMYFGNAQKTEFLSSSTILVCLLPLTPQTANILNKNTLSLLPPAAYLINVARGGHLLEEDLIPLINSGQLSGACLDVFKEEPLPKEHPFWHHPRIKITPHVASVSEPAAVVPQLVENYLKLSRGETLNNRVDRIQGY